MSGHRSLEPYVCPNCGLSPVLSRRREPDDPILCGFCQHPLELVRNSTVSDARAYARAFGPREPSGRSILLRTPAEAGAGEAYIGAEEFAKRTGLTLRTVQRWCKEERIPGAIQPGGYAGSWLLPASQVERWRKVAQNCDEEAA